MDDRSIVFLEVMIAIGVIGVVTFLIYLVSRRVRPQEAGTSDEQGAATPAPVQRRLEEESVSTRNP